MKIIIHEVRKKYTSNQQVVQHTPNNFAGHGNFPQPQLPSGVVYLWNAHYYLVFQIPFLASHKLLIICLDQSRSKYQDPVSPWFNLHGGTKVCPCSQPLVCSQNCLHEPRVNNTQITSCKAHPTLP